ncbi:MAG TPA: tetratricopeptide repeat protein [Chthonomonadales bacterium]|nr:tetratricopeptide repeat protein [Chthonomonadales bacterium]
MEAVLEVRRPGVEAVTGGAYAPDPVTVAEAVLRRYGPRAVSLLVSARRLDDGRVLPPRLSANDCYVALHEACRKVARVASRRIGHAGGLHPGQDLGCALDRAFPDPVGYLARAIRSVVSDAARAERREPRAVSLETPVAVGADGMALRLTDTIAEDRTDRRPEEALLDGADRSAFREALLQAMERIPSNYLEALQRDVARERQREAGERLSAQSDRDRQTLCRARAALAQILRRECGDGNPFVRLLANQRTSRVLPKPIPSSSWTGERQEQLFRRLLQSPWAERADLSAEGAVDEAIVNDVTDASPVSPPSPELRQTMRVLDLYTVDKPVPRGDEAKALYEQARAARQQGRLEEALRLYRACHDAEPRFVEALNEVGVMHSQLGQLREALRVYLGIVEREHTSEHRFIAATNAADIYLTWFDAGRARDRNIELAIRYATLAMERPTPMRACNLVLALVKDRYFDEAAGVLRRVLAANTERCPAEKFLRTLFQIRDPDLVAWWAWLDDQTTKEQ